MFARKNRQAGLLGLATLLLVVQSISQDPAQSRVKLADRISGVVINSVTREPIARALVVSEGERHGTMTDSNGRFEFVFGNTPTAGEASTEPGRSVYGSVSPAYRPHMVTARKPGFLNGANEMSQSPQQMFYGKDVEIALVPEGLIVGHVALPTSEAPDSVQVQLYRKEARNGRGHWTSLKLDSTRSDGEFRFAELPAGSYRLMTQELRDEDAKSSTPGGQVFGYAPVYYPNASGFASAATIEVTPGKTVEANIALVRQPYFPVFVPVRNVPPGKPIGLQVYVQGPGGPGYELRYDYEREAIVGLLPNGSYRVQAASVGNESFSGEAQITVHGGSQGTILPLAATAPVRVTAKNEPTSRELSSYTTTTVTADGKTSSRQLSFGVTLSLGAADDLGLQQQNGSLQGSLDSENTSTQIDNVLPGRYWLEVYAENGYVASATAGGVDLLHHPLVVPFGSSAPAIEITIRHDKATVEGVVEGASSLTGPAAPIKLGLSGWGGPSGMESSARAYFIPLPDSPGRFTESFVNKDGTFSLSLAPGDYRALVFPEVQPDLEYENPEAMRAYDGKGQVVRLTGGQKEKLHLQLVSPSE